MNQITIRDVEVRDIPEIKVIIGTVWDWLDLIDDTLILDATLGIYLNQVLYKATFGRVAILNDKVVGTIFGSVDGAEPKYRMLLEDGSAHALTLLGASEKNRKNVFEYLSRINNINEQLLSAAPGNYDGTLDFLILANESQGSGIGKNLWMALKSYFEKNGAKSVYLFSDTECNVGFYEHYGFTRRGAQSTAFDFGGDIFETDIFLYDIQL